MRFIGPFFFAITTLIALVFSTSAACAQAYKTFYSDTSDNSGSFAFGKLVRGSDGNFYGTTAFGGLKNIGTVFKMTPDGNVVTLLSFNSTNGALPVSELVEGVDGNFYGTTSKGGTNGFGTAFKISPTGEITQLVSFDSTNGATPLAGLVKGADGDFYGTTSKGGTSDFGTVFKISPTGLFTLLISFENADGHNPSAVLTVGSDGNFYGATLTGGALNAGTVFKITPAGALTTLASLDSAAGLYPSGVIQGNDGNFYGTAAAGGNAGTGTVFKVTPAGVLTRVFSFDSTSAGNPATPLALGSDGNFYGTTTFGGNKPATGPGSRAGIVFKLTPAGALTTLTSFGYDNQSNSHAGLLMTSDGSLYGITANGSLDGFQGPNPNPGKVFKITPDGEFIPLHSFIINTLVGKHSSLVVGNDGAFYGMTGEGRFGDAKTFFKVTSDGTHTTLGSIANTPSNDLVKGSNGNFYGVTPEGGTGVHKGGTVFEVTPAGTVTTLVSFDSDKGNGESPQGGLIVGSDGNFYGTTATGGNSSAGTVFKLTPAGLLTTLVSFDYMNGRNPAAALVEGNDGNFYGTTAVGGEFDLGTIFKVTPGGGLTKLVTFNETNGKYPQSALTLGNDGNFYGVAAGGGPTGLVFRMTPAGVLTTIYKFSGIDGAFPTSGLVKDADGNFYGTTLQGGPDDSGTIFKVTPEGILTTLHFFDGTTASYPLCKPVFGSDGKLYGTANGLVVWQVDPAAAAPLIGAAPTTDITPTSASPAGFVTVNAPENARITMAKSSAVTASSPTTSVSFQYGLTTEYGSFKSATSTRDVGKNIASVIATLSNLSPNRSYHCRLVATNSKGVTYGPNTVFFTKKGAPTKSVPVIGV